MSKFWSKRSDDSESSSSSGDSASDNEDNNDDGSVSWSTDSDHDENNPNIPPTGDFGGDDSNETIMASAINELATIHSTDNIAHFTETFSAQCALSPSLVGDDKLDPNLVWERIKKDQIFAPIPMASAATKKSTHCTRIVCMSDTHGQHRDIPFVPPGDILVHGGDFTKSGEIGTVQDMDDYFKEHKNAFNKIICIAGNHELTFQTEFYKTAKRKHKPKAFDPDKTKAILQNSDNRTYLEDSSVDIGRDKHSVELYGSPWTPAFYDWGIQSSQRKSFAR